MISLYQLSIFLTIVDEGNFSAAAQKLHMTQPAVSMQIRGMEERYQMKLFERVGQRMTPTARAQALIAPARELLALAHRTERVIADPSEELSGRLSVAVSVEVRGLPALLAGFQRQYPAVRISGTWMSEAEALSALRGGHAELGVLSYAPSSRQFDSKLLLEDELVPAVSPLHEWVVSDEATFNIAALSAQPLVLPRAGSELRYTIEESLEGYGLNRQNLAPALELEGIEPVALAIEAGAGLGFIPRSRLSANAIGLGQTFGDHRHPPRPLIIPLTAHLVRLRRTPPSAVAAAFWNYRQANEE